MASWLQRFQEAILYKDFCMHCSRTEANPASFTDNGLYAVNAHGEASSAMLTHTHPHR